MSARRDQQARERLRPLAPGERPTTLLVASIVAGALAIAVLAGAFSSTDLAKRGGSIPGGVFIALVLGALALNMYRKRYWAVLGFEALLAFQMVVATLALVVASTLLAAGICLAALILGGTLFWKLVSVMGRLQATSRDGDRGRLT